MEKTIKYSAGGIVVDSKTEKILLTKKLAQKEYKAQMIKSLLHLLKINPETTLQKFKLWCFTKGKIENNNTKEQTAFQEIEEEWWLKKADILQKKYLWSFTKKKKYGYKEVDMFLYITNKEPWQLQPTDKRHIAAFIEIDKVIDTMENKEEKIFFSSIKQEIKDILIEHKKLDILPLNNTTKNVT